MTYSEIDFNALYKEQKEKSTFKMKSQGEWDKKAVSMNQRVHNSIYNDAFLSLIDTSSCESVLDVGCGVGNLSLRLASKMSCIYALDYSKKMLELLEQNMAKDKIDNIIPMNKSWYDSWEDIPSCDIVIASRSMEVEDMKSALIKLNDKANKRVYLSYKVGGSFINDDILKAMNRTIIKKPDYIYLVNILYSMGICANVQLIESEGRSSVYSSCDEFIKSVQWSIGEISLQERKALEQYYLNEVQNNVSGTDFVQWAIISWDKKE